ncbi:hypothetical protein Trydic_g14874 [Trypoxylus dichotomus]
MYGFLMNQQQYRNAYPVIPYQQPPNASNGYGWHGNGYGWQVDNIDQGRTGLEEIDVEEPVLTEQKVEHQTRGVFSSKQKFKSVSGSIHQKSSNKLPSTSCFSANNLKVKALHKTPIYVHDPGQTSLLRNRVQSDFVYVPPYPNRDRQENATESDTTCDQSVKKVSIKGFLQRHTTTNQKKVPPVSENLRNKSPTGCQNTVEDRLVVANEKVSKKDEVSLLQSETSRSEIRHKDEQPIQDFELYEEMLKTHPRQVLSQFVLTEEERRRIQSTLPPGEPIVIPKIYATIFDKFGRSFRVLAKNSRKCLCQPDVSKHVNPLPSTEVPDKSKRATFLVDGKKNQKPGLKSKESSSIGGTKRKLSSERKSSIPFNTKLTLLEGAPKDFKIPKEADFGFKFGRRIRTKKKPIRRPPEKKVDEDDVYKSLVSVSTGRLNRSQYQLHYHLRIKGPSVMKDLKFDPVKVYINTTVDDSLGNRLEKPASVAELLASHFCNMGRPLPLHPYTVAVLSVDTSLSFPDR